jgi:hypothetical protein
MQRQHHVASGGRILAEAHDAEAAVASKAGGLTSTTIKEDTTTIKEDTTTTEERSDDNTHKR